MCSAAAGIGSKMLVRKSLNDKDSSVTDHRCYLYEVQGKGKEKRGSWFASVCMCRIWSVEKEKMMEDWLVKIREWAGDVIVLWFVLCFSKQLL